MILLSVKTLQKAFLSHLHLVVRPELLFDLGVHLGVVQRRDVVPCTNFSAFRFLMRVCPRACLGKRSGFA